jgi:hypothetical protein
MAAAIYSTTAQEGIDINALFILDAKGTPEYPAPPFQPGELAWGTDGSEWVYATASVTIGRGQVVIFNVSPGSWSVAPITNTLARAGYGNLLGVVGGSQGSLFVPAPSGSQTATYFWVQRAGNAPAVAASGTISPSASLFSSTVTGNVTGSLGAATNAILNGIVMSAATPAAGSGFGSAILNYPTSGVSE